MPKKRKARRPTGKRHASSATEALIGSKREALLKAEREYWQQRNSLRKRYAELADSLTLKPLGDEAELSSTVWGLRDGAAFVRYPTIKGSPKVDFRVLDITLDDWGREGLFVPARNRETGESVELSLPKSGVLRGIGSFTFSDVGVNEFQIDHVEVSHLRYGEEGNLPSVEAAVRDFQLTILGLIVEGEPGRAKGVPVKQESVLEQLDAVASSFEKLLDESRKEEELQSFLKEHPYMLDFAASAIPKQKLGDDFITDFVLVAPLQQGTSYTFVELERADFPILTKDGSLSNETTHALKQTTEWSAWLEKNQVYLATKLPGLESPKYAIIIGKAGDLTDTQKDLLRAYNRSWVNTTLIGFDDVLTRFRTSIDQLRSATGSSDTEQKPDT